MSRHRLTVVMVALALAIAATAPAQGSRRAAPANAQADESFRDLRALVHGGERLKITAKTGGDSRRNPGGIGAGVGALIGAGQHGHRAIYLSPAATPDGPNFTVSRRLLEGVGAVQQPREGAR